MRAEGGGVKVEELGLDEVPSMEGPLLWGDRRRILA